MNNIKKITQILSLAIIFVFSVVYMSSYASNILLDASNLDDNLGAEYETVQAFNDYVAVNNNGVKALLLTPGTDFFEDTSMTEEQVLQQIDIILKDLVGLDFNNVILKLNFGSKVIHNSDIVESFDFDMLDMFIQKAKLLNVGVHPVINIYDNSNKQNGVIGSSELTVETLDLIMSYIADFGSKYYDKIDSLMLDNYHVNKNSENFELYKLNGGGIGYEEWLTDTNSYFINNITTYLKGLDNSKPIGLYASAVWSNIANDELGSETTSKFQALQDGMSDTKMFVENDYVSYAMVDANGSLTDPEIPFKQVINWWSGLGAEFYVLHSADKVATSNPGWNGIDQLIRQLSEAMKTPGYMGSVYSGYKKLIANENGSTSALLKFYREEYSEANLFKDLVVTTPPSTYTETYEQKIQFTGKFDPEFEVTINNEPIIPTKTGEFLIDYNVDLGETSFNINHKGQSKTYKVVRKLKLLNSVEPTGNIALEGGSVVSLNVVAHRDAAVSASVGGRTSNLTKLDASDGLDGDSVYVNYKGNITLPGSTSVKQNLGKIKFTGSYNGSIETLYGANITIEPVVNDFGSVGGGQGDPNNPSGSPSVGTGKFVEITSNYADIFSSKDTEVYAPPRLYTMPSGTLDYYTRTTTISGTTYYITNSGNRIKSSEARLINLANKGNNTISGTRISSDSGSTYIRVSEAWRSPFNIEFSDLPAGNSISAFNSSSVIITFNYTTSVPNIDISGITNSSLFTSARWEKSMNGNISQYKLILGLRKNGAYYGASSYYEGNDLVIRFSNAAKSLSGLRILIDPGHGINDPGARGSYVQNGATNIIYESTLNWNLAVELRNQLQAQGAIVSMLDTKSQTRYSGTTGLYNRVRDAQAFNPHVSLAVHHNSAGVNNATGVETYYNTPFSKPLAKSINDSLASYYNGTMYNDGRNRNRGDKFSEFLVTRVKTHAAVLIEYGFVSTPSELQRLNDPNHIRGLARSTVNGLINYVNLGK